jgi:hypothetical protein
MPDMAGKAALYVGEKKDVGVHREEYSRASE